MINPAYDDPTLARVRDTLAEDDMVLLHKVLIPEGFHELKYQLSKLQHVKEHHPLKYLWHRAKDKHVAATLEEHDIMELLRKVTGKRFAPSLYVLGKGHFSMLHDDLEKTIGHVAFFDLSSDWHHTWGGYIGVGGQQFDLAPNSLLLLKLHGHQWFVKRVGHNARNSKVLLVFREVQK